MFCRLLNEQRKKKGFFFFLNSRAGILNVTFNFILFLQKEKKENPTLKTEPRTPNSLHKLLRKQVCQRTRIQVTNLSYFLIINTRH